MTYLKSDLEQALEELPDLVADAKLKWLNLRTEFKARSKKLKSELRVEHPDWRASDIENIVGSNEEIFKLECLQNVAESEYERLYEKLLCTKKEAGLRSSF